jgi:hypothetical protein
MSKAVQHIEFTAVDAAKHTINLDKVSLAVVGDIAAEKAGLLSKSEAIKSVASDDEAQAALNVAAELKGAVKSVDKKRETFKAPVLLLGRAIDSTAKEFITPVETEAKRLERLAGDWALKKEREHQAEIARQQAEAERLRRQQEEEARKAQEAAEAARKAAEQATTPEDKEAAEDAAFEAELAASIPVSAPVPAAVVPDKPKFAGASVQMVKEPVIEDIHALYAAYPSCVELTAKLSNIKDLIKRGITDIPGVRFEERAAVSAKAAARRS